MSNWFQADPDSLLMQRIETSGRLGRHAAAWLMLVWSVWIFLTPLSAPRTFPHWMVPTLASYAVFLLLFYCAYYRARRYVPWCVVGFALLGYLVTPFNAGAHGYLIYACAFLAFCARWRIATACLFRQGRSEAVCDLPPEGGHPPAAARGRIVRLPVPQGALESWIAPRPSRDPNGNPSARLA